MSKRGIGGDGYTVNMSLTLDEILSHNTEPDLISFTIVPENKQLAFLLFNSYAGSYENLFITFADEITCEVPKYSGFCGIFRRAADAGLSECVAVKDDVEVFFPLDVIVEVLVNDNHYICRSTSIQEFESICCKYGIF
jgi:hypothetical protein